MSQTETYPKAEFVRKPNLSESCICPNTECSEVPKCGLNTRHNREVTFTHLTGAQILRSDK